MNEKKKQKSYFLNIQFILGLALFVIFIVGVFVLNNIEYKSVKTPGTPFTKPDFSDLYLGTDYKGRDILTNFLYYTVSDAFIILSAWFICLVISIPLGLLASKKKWLGEGIKGILSFGPSIVIAGILIYLINMEIYGVALALGIGLAPYFISKFSYAFEKDIKPYIYFNSIYALFFSALIVQFAGFFNLFRGLGFEIQKSIDYAVKYPYLLFPYAVSSFLLILFPSIMARGIKNAHAYNIGIELGFPEGKKVPPEVKEKIDEINETIVEEHVIEEKEPLEIDAIFQGCPDLQSVENRITDFLVNIFDFSHAYFYKVDGDNFEIRAIRKKVVPKELIEIQKENQEFQAKSYKFAFLNTLKEKEKPYFVYPGKDNYNRIFHHLIVHGLVKYIVEVSFNKEHKNQDEEIDRLLKFIPLAESMLEKYIEEEILELGGHELNAELGEIKIEDEQKRAGKEHIQEQETERHKVEEKQGREIFIESQKERLVDKEQSIKQKKQDIYQPMEIGKIEKVKEQTSASGGKSFEVVESVGKVVREQDKTGKKCYKVVSSTGKVIKRSDEIDELVGKGEIFYENGLEQVTGNIEKTGELIQEEPDEHIETGKKYSKKSKVKSFEEHTDKQQLEKEPKLSDEFYAKQEQRKPRPYAPVDEKIIIESEEEISGTSSEEIFLDVDVETTANTTIPLQETYENREDDEYEYHDHENFEPEGLFTTRFEDKLNKGLRYLKANDYNRALFFLKDANALNPDSYQVYMAIGHVYRHKKLYSEALENYRLALQKNKYSSNAYNYIGNILYTNNKYNLALRAWEKAYMIDPGRTIIKKNIEKLKKVIDKTK